MGVFFTEIPPDLIDWIKLQKYFLVGSAPLSAQGHVNISPRGYDCLTIVSPTSCYYVDMTGSGNETISHLREPGNKRMTIMFNAFQGPPRIVRLFGTGKVFERHSPEFNALLPPGDDRLLPGTRAIIWLDIHAVGSSCGMSVPFYSYEGERMALQEWALKREQDDEVGKRETGLKAYWFTKNIESIDGLPGLQLGFDASEKGLAPAVTEAQRATMRLQRFPPSKSSVWNPDAKLLQGVVLGAFVMWLAMSFLPQSQGG